MDITQARDQQNLDAVKSYTLTFLMDFKLKIAEERIPVSKNRRGKYEITKHFSTKRAY